MRRSQSGQGQGFNVGVGVIAGVVIVILLVIGCICSFCGITTVLVALANDDSGATARSPGESRRFQPAGQNNDASSNNNPASVGPGQDVMVGNVRWKILEAQDMGNTLQSNDGFVEPLTTNERFIRVRFEIENQGTEALTFSDVNLVDAQGRAFEDSTDALISFVEEQERCLFEQMNPNVSRICTTIFEVPVDAAGLKAHVGDLELFGSAEAFINLDLTDAPAAFVEEAAPPAEEADQPPSSGEGESQPPSSGEGESQPPSSGEGEDQPPSSGEGEDQPPSSGEGEDLPPATGEGNTVPVGQDVFIGQTRWRLLGPAQDLGDYLVDETEEIDPLESAGSFIQVRFEVENVGLEPVEFQEIILIDNQARRFESSLDAIWFIEEEEQCLDEEVEPSLSKMCTLIYEIPFDSGGLKAEVHDLFSADAGVVLLDLDIEEAFE